MQLDPVAALNFHLTVEDAIQHSDAFICETDTLIMVTHKGKTVYDTYTEVIANEALLTDLSYYNKFSCVFSLDTIDYN